MNACLGDAIWALMVYFIVAFILKKTVYQKSGNV